MTPDRHLDLTAEICPMTFVRTRLALDALAPGQILSVQLLGEEPIRSVPATARLQGHAVLAEESQPNGTVRVIIRKRPVS